RPSAGATLMARAVVTYVCSECGAHSPVAMGRCSRCGTWGSLVEERREAATPAGPAGAARRPGPLASFQLEDIDDAELVRLPSGDAEVDRVLGGGWVAGAAVLLTGEPGIGKSTLLLQLSRSVNAGGMTSLYVAGEESPAQVRLRADRLGRAGGRSAAGGSTPSAV